MNKGWMLATFNKFMIESEHLKERNKEGKNKQMTCTMPASTHTRIRTNT